MKTAAAISKAVTPGKKTRAPKIVRWNMCLYVAGHSPRGAKALSNLKEICEAQLKGRYTIDVIDIAKHPALARKNQIFALPTLVRKLPPPMSKLIGDLSDRARVLVALNLADPGLR